MKTGRPVETPFSRYENFNKRVAPSPIGGHNWQAMAYNPVTKLVYIPSREMSYLYGNRKDFKYDPKTWNTASNIDEKKKRRRTKKHKRHSADSSLGTLY